MSSNTTPTIPTSSNHPTNSPPNSTSSSSPGGIGPSTTGLSNPNSPAPLRPVFLTLLVACPLLALLPPRKLDLYTFSLAGAWVISAEELAFGSARRPRTGNTGVMGILSTAQTDLPPSQPPSLREREERLRPGLGIPTTAATKGDPIGTEEAEKNPDESQSGITGLARKLWLGDEKPGWQQRRLQKEREELESGSGYGDIILKQVREVLPRFGGKAAEEDDED